MLALALCACRQERETVIVPISDGFQPLAISLQIADEDLALTFLSPERARITISTLAQESLLDDEPVIRTIAVLPDSYRQARSQVLALLAANGIQPEGAHGPGVRVMTVSIGGGSGQLMLTISSDAQGGLPAGCQALCTLVEATRHAPDAAVGTGR